METIERVYELAAERNISINKLAEMSGVSASTIKTTKCRCGQLKIDTIPYGHGEKSVMMIEEYMKLLPIERYAIRWHIGPYSGEKDRTTLAAAMDKHPLVMALFEADMEASHLVGKQAIADLRSQITYILLQR